MCQDLQNIQKAKLKVASYEEYKQYIAKFYFCD